MLSVQGYRSPYVSPYSFGQAEAPIVTKTTVLVGVSAFLIGALWGWFASQA